MTPTRLAEGYGLLEAARWHPQLGLVFSDMTVGGVHHLPAGAARPEVLIPHRKAVGGHVAHADGGLVLSGRNICRKAPDGTTEVLQETAADEQFFNDITADGRGRLYTGSVAVGASHHGGPPGRLYRLDLDGTRTVLADDVLVSNGLSTDPSDEVLLHADSPRRLVRTYSLEDGSETDPFVDTSEYDGLPDGLAVAADGSVWLAIAGAGVVVGWDAKGVRLQEVAVPTALVTSVCFGGPDLSTLYVLTGVNDEHPDPHGGMIFSVDVGRSGLPAPLARVRAGSVAT